MLSEIFPMERLGAVGGGIEDQVELHQSSRAGLLHNFDLSSHLVNLKPRLRRQL